MDLVIHDVAVPRHSIGDHHAGTSVFDQVTCLQHVHPERAGAIPLAILFRQLFHIKQWSAAHQPFDPSKGRVVGLRCRIAAVVFKLATQKTTQCLAIAVVGVAYSLGRIDMWNRILASRSHRPVLSPQPAQFPALNALNSLPSGQGSSRTN